MKKEDLIKMIEELPDGCEIGTIFPDECRVARTVIILGKDKKLVSGNTEMTIREIEQSRRSNNNSICDYYIY